MCLYSNWCLTRKLIKIIRSVDYFVILFFPMRHPNCLCYHMMLSYDGLSLHWNWLFHHFHTAIFSMKQVLIIYFITWCSLITFHIQLNNYQISLVYYSFQADKSKWFVLSHWIVSCDTLLSLYLNDHSFNVDTSKVLYFPMIPSWHIYTILSPDSLSFYYVMLFFPCW